MLKRIWKYTFPTPECSVFQARFFVNFDDFGQTFAKPINRANYTKPNTSNFAVNKPRTLHYKSEYNSDR